MAVVKEHITCCVAFISDVKNEVDSAKRIVDLLNQDFEISGFYINLKTWEDIPEGFGRPQEIINKELIEKCDIFIGVIWKKWGIPIGENECGFREEFGIAEKRYNSTGSPLIWLYAKDVKEDEIQESEKKDYGKVKKFKEEIVSGRKGILKTFRETTDWEELIRSRLTEFMLSKCIKEGKRPSYVKEKPQIAIASGQRQKAVARLRFPKEIRHLTEKLKSVVSGVKKLEKLNVHERARLFLLSSAFLYDINTYEILGNHEIQLLYLFREKIKTIGVENKLILRSLIADPYNHKAGWYWMHKLNKIIRDYVGYLGLKDVSNDVRKGSVKFLEKFWSKKYIGIIAKAIKDRDKDVAMSALHVIAKHGDISSLKIIEECFSNSESEVVKSAWTAKFAILTRFDPDEARSFLLKSPKDHREGYLSYLEELINKTSLEKIRELVSDTDKTVQRMAYLKLMKNGQIDDGELHSLLSSDIPEVRKTAYLILIERGERFDPAKVKEDWSKLGTFFSDTLLEQVIEKIFEKCSKEELEKEVSWFSVFGPEAYYKLGCLDFENLKLQIYKDLGSEFKELQDKYIREYRAELEKVLEKKMNKKLEDLGQEGMNQARMTIEKIVEKEMQKNNKVHDFVKENFVSSALKILMQKEDSSSVKFARKYLLSSNKELQEQSVDIIGKYGNSEDVTELVKVSFNSYGDLKIKAAIYAVKLDSDEKNGSVKQFLISNDPHIVKMCFSLDLKERKSKLLSQAKELLYNKEDEIRILSLSYLLHLLNKRGLNKLLREYTGKSSYYYNVVCWLDRCLYAPPKFGKVYKTELLGKLQISDKSVYIGAVLDILG